jgi:hypothetical protein
MLTVATYFWNPDPGSKFAVAYTPDDVRRLQRNVARHLTVPHQFACITDRPHMFDADKDIRAIPIDWATHVPGTCFVRLMTFHPEGRDMIGERVLQLDLDTLIVGDLAPLVERQEDLVLWRNPALHPKRPGRSLYNTSILLHRCGSMPELWKCFLDMGKKTPAKDDQWYLSDALGPGVPYFDGERDGVYRIAREDTPGSGVNGELPDNACIVTFPGSNGKWTLPHIAAANPWIAEHRVQ